MDQGFKHFSHLHNLVMHQMPVGTEVSCSGCNSLATTTVYVCWQCNFFLHEQCFKATRSLKHSSHPPHPLTLVPYPTYPSNSFYCNSCRIIGTGFSYSCADCEFDLHVQCAYSISGPSPIPTWNGIQNSIPFTPPHSISHVNYHSTPHDQSYVSIPSGHQNPIPTVIANPVSIPSGHQNPIPTVIANPVSIPPAGYPSVSIPSVQYPSLHQNGPKDNTIIHFNHPHNLTTIDLNDEKGNNIICSGCKGTIIGKGYSCNFSPNCNFHLHESCFNLKKQIQHKSHPEHPLNLLAFAPYNNKNNEYTCNACYTTGRGFTYNCSICKFDLHITCSRLFETVKRPDHEHTLKLFYSCPVQGDVTCDVCYGGIEKDRWAYYCESCNSFDTHLGCVDCEKQKKDSVVDTQVQLQKLQMEMQMTQQLAQMMASMGASISNLAG